MRWRSSPRRRISRTNDTWRWQIQLGQSAILGLGLLISSMLIVETPAFEAKMLLRSNQSAHAMQHKASDSSHGTNAVLGISALFQKEHRTSLWIAFILAACDQLTGINAFIFYAPRIFTSAGLSNVLVWSILIVGVWNLLAVFFAVAIVDRFGRKPLMMMGLGLMTFACAMMVIGYAEFPGIKDQLAMNILSGFRG